MNPTPQVRYCLPARSCGRRAVAQLGSALDWGSRGRRFKSCQPDGNVAGQGLNPEDRIEALDMFWGPIGGWRQPMVRTQRAAANSMHDFDSNAVADRRSLTWRFSGVRLAPLTAGQVRQPHTRMLWWLGLSTAVGGWSGDGLDCPLAKASQPAPGSRLACESCFAHRPRHPAALAIAYDAH